MKNKEKIKKLEAELRFHQRKAKRLIIEIDELKTNSDVIHDEIKNIVSGLNSRKTKNFSWFAKRGNKIIAYLKKPAEVIKYTDRDGVPMKSGIPFFHSTLKKQINKSFGTNFIKSGKPLGNGKGFTLEISQSYLKNEGLI